MAKYIDADELIADGWHLERHAPNGRCLTMMSIADVPTADVVEVVRCGECKEWKRNVGVVDSPNGHCFCHGIQMNAYDFCSYGERKDT